MGDSLCNLLPLVEKPFNNMSSLTREPLFANHLILLWLFLQNEGLPIDKSLFYICYIYYTQIYLYIFIYNITQIYFYIYFCIFVLIYHNKIISQTKLGQMKKSKRIKLFCTSELLILKSFWWLFFLLWDNF